eukprot:TRINITY_DN566_c0_g1_i1.p1 TRINITY_DN566_c0_g1~~TRINITY_DN566_c0_g1_i1.p1  ORF type:complete len:437 (-),score=98.02 TRINITY_DN566_c0_g1_i1:30-1340(-)
MSTSSAPQVQRAIFGRPFHIPLKVPVDISELGAELYDEQGNFVLDVEIAQVSEGDFTIVWLPTSVGEFSLHILVRNEARKVIPVEVIADSPLKLKSDGRLFTYVNLPVEFEIDVPSELHPEEVQVLFVLEGEDKKEEVGKTTISSKSDTKLSISFLPYFSGTFSASVLTRSQGEMAGKLIVDVCELPSIVLQNKDATSVTMGNPHTWVLKVAHVPVDDFKVIVTNPKGEKRVADIQQIDADTLHVVFTPQMPGLHQAELKLKGGSFSTPLTLEAINQENTEPEPERLQSEEDIFISLPSRTVGTAEHHENFEPLPIFTELQDQQDHEQDHQQDHEQDHQQDHEQDHESSTHGYTEEVPVGETIIVSVTMSTPESQIEVLVKDENGSYIDHAVVTRSETSDTEISISYKPERPGLYYLDATIDGEPQPDPLVKFLCV